MQKIGVAVPNFWFAMLLVLLFSTTLRWVSAGGFPGWDAGIGPALGALALPAVSLALPQAHRALAHAPCRRFWQTPLGWWRT